MLLALFAAAGLLPQQSDQTIRSVLAIGSVTQGGRVPFPSDLVQAQVASAKFAAPAEGDKLGNGTWRKVEAGADGTFQAREFQGGYAWAVVDSEDAKPMLLRAAGDSLVYINGELRAGDPYGYGYLDIPFQMKKGKNTFLFTCGRGSLKASLLAPKSTISLNTGDMTLPDVLTGTEKQLTGALPVVNATGNRLDSLNIKVFLKGTVIGYAKLPRVEPWTLRKVPFTFKPPMQGDGGELDLRLGLESKGVVLDQADIKVRVRKPTEHFKETLISKIDGSVQYFAVAPSLAPSKSNALILTVHGASVEALNQAQAYRPKDWCTIVAPTNRRPFGFDWEDWGRMDGMEVWEIAKKRFPHDPQRVALTGHSMGGHGTWQLGLTYPDQWAAIGPSAGWVSFWSYAGGWEPKDPTPVEAMMRRAMNPSDTLGLLRNGLGLGIYILHGDADDNVPVQQARTMRDAFAGIGKQVQYHEQHGAGHWWGDECVDWPAMFEMFKGARLGERKQIAFSTYNPGISSRYGEVTIEQQEEPLKLSRLVMEQTPDGWAQATTENISFITFSPALSKGLKKLIIDAQTIDKPGTKLFKIDGKWISDQRMQPLKSASLTGPFKLAFQNRMVFVVGTSGTDEENAWSWRKARYDAETWYYRGNGAVDIITDREPLPKGRNIILYGNRDTNRRWTELLSRSPLQVSRTEITLGGRRYSGALALFLYPQGGRMVGVVAPTDMPSARYADRLPYFTSGIAYPDWTIATPETLTAGTKAATAAGFFDNNWQFDPAQAAFRG